LEGTLEEEIMKVTEGELLRYVPNTRTLIIGGRNEDGERVEIDFPVPDASLFLMNIADRFRKAAPKEGSLEGAFISDSFRIGRMEGADGEQLLYFEFALRRMRVPIVQPLDGLSEAGLQQIDRILALLVASLNAGAAGAMPS
jgi:hypothetical protein